MPGKIVPAGRIRMNRMRAAFPYQEQPALSLPDQVLNLSFGNTEEFTNIAVDGLAGCAHTSRVYVPHNQRITQYNFDIIDNDTALAPSLPTVEWTVALEGPAKCQMFPNRPYNFQQPDFFWDGTGDPSEILLKADADVQTQGISLRWSRNVFGGINADEESNYELRWTSGFRRWRLLVNTATSARVEVNEAGLDDAGDPDEENWKLVHAGFKLGINPVTALGNMNPAEGSGAQSLEVVIMGETMQVALGAQTSPYKIPGGALGPKVPPTLELQNGGSLPLALFTVAYAWRDIHGNESKLSPGAGISTSGGDRDIKVTIPALPSAADTVAIYVSGPGTNGWRLSDTLNNITGDIETTVTLPGSSNDEPPNLVKPIITAVGVRAKYFTQFSLSAHEHKWSTHGAILSNPNALGFSPALDTEPYYMAAGFNTTVILDSGEPWDSNNATPLRFPDGSAITLTTQSSPGAPDVVYLLEIDNEEAGTYGGEPYADFTATITKVFIEVDGKFSTQQSTSKAIIPKRVVERIFFDPNQLCIDHTVNIIADNFYGQWAGQMGNVAFKLWLGYKTPANFGVPRYGDPDAQGLYSRFVGFCNEFNFQIPGASRATIGFDCIDQMYQIGANPLASPALVDGWNHYSAAAYFSQAAGITASRMAFANLVPAKTSGGLATTLAADPTARIDPFGTAPGDTEPYFLPTGTGNRPWTPRNRTMPIIDLLNFIRKPTGFLNYIDNKGLLQYHKWVPFAPGTVFRTFNLNDSDNLDGFWDFRLRVSTKNVRNRILLVGIDPFADFYNVLISKREDSYSINAPLGQEPPNFVGFPQTMVWVDPRFASPEFVSTSADRILEMLRIPLVEAQFSTWMQPDLFPMDVVYLNEHKTGVLNIPLYVMGITNVYGVDDRGRVECRSHITGRFLV